MTPRVDCVKAAPFACALLNLQVLSIPSLISRRSSGVRVLLCSGFWRQLLRFSSSTTRSGGGNKEKNRTDYICGSVYRSVPEHGCRANDWHCEGQGLRRGREALDRCHGGLSEHRQRSQGEYQDRQAR